MKVLFCCPLILLVMGLVPSLILDAAGQTSVAPSTSSQSLAPSEFTRRLTDCLSGICRPGHGNNGSNYLDTDPVQPAGYPLLQRRDHLVRLVGECQVCRVALGWVRQEGPSTQAATIWLRRLSDRCFVIPLSTFLVRPRFIRIDRSIQTQSQECLSVSVSAAILYVG